MAKVTNHQVVVTTNHDGKKEGRCTCGQKSGALATTADVARWAETNGHVN